MIMFLVLNTSGLTLIPISIMVYRAQLGAAQLQTFLSLSCWRPFFLHLPVLLQ